jgi:hypothetical protein
MGMFGKKKPVEEPEPPSRRVRPAVSKGKPKRSKSSDDILFTGLKGVSNNKKVLKSSSSFEKKPLRQTRSGMSLKSKDSAATTKSSKNNTKTSSKASPSLEMLMSLQNETNKVAADSQWGNVLTPSSHHKNPSSNSSFDHVGRPTRKKKPLKSENTRGRSKSPKRPVTSSRGRSLGRLKASKSENLSGMVSGKSSRGRDRDSDDSHGGGKKGSSKLAQMKSDEVATLKKENHDLYTKKRNIQRQLEDERGKTENLEKKIKDVQKQLERGNKISNASKNKKDPTKELEERIETLERDLTELQTKLKRERREHEQILFEKEKELKGLDESLEQFMEADRSKNGGVGGVTDRKIQNELTQSKAALRVAEGQLSKLQTEISHKDLELRTLKGKRSSLQTITKADSDSIHVRKENEELNEKLKFKDETIDHLMEQLKTLKLSGSSDMKRRMSGKLEPETDDSGLTGLWNKLSPGTLRNRKTLDRSQRKELAAPNIS